MDELDVSAIVATTQENVGYLTGVHSIALEMFPHTGQVFAVAVRDGLDAPVFISSGCEVDQFLDAAVRLTATRYYGTFHREKPAGDVVLTAAERELSAVMSAPAEQTAQDALRRVLSELGVSTGRVAIDEDGVPAGFLASLIDRCDGMEIQPAAAMFRWARKVKTSHEIARLTEAARLAEQGIDAVLSVARPGMTDRAMVAEFDRYVVGHGGRPKFTLIKIGRDAVAGQTRPAGTVLRRGDSIWFDVGLVYHGYWADIARTAVLGEPTPKLAKFYDAMLSGEDVAIAEAHPGMTGGELFALTVDAVRASGVPHYRRHHVGHGIGVEVYDRVLITPDNDDVIDEGTVVNIETPYYEFGFGSVHVEDPFVVGAQGNSLLTTSRRDLRVID